MTTLTLKLQLDESLVLAYRQAKPKEKAVLKKQLEQWFVQQWGTPSEKIRLQNIEEMIARMDEIGKEAEANGLTEEIIDEILAES